MMPDSPDRLFVPSEDVAVLLNAALDVYERRTPSPPQPPAFGGMRGVRPIKILLRELTLPGYFSQLDPNPRLIANEQLQTLEQAGLLRLKWEAGERGHLLEGVYLPPANAAPIFHLLNRTPASDHRARLEDRIRGELFRFPDGRPRRALQHVLRQLKSEKSAAPFILTDPEFNQDLLAALSALAGVEPETPYRVFSVRVFNNSKRFEDLKRALVRLACLGQPEWCSLEGVEVLRELNLVPNPGYLYLSGPWQMVDEWGQVLSLGEFSPAVGLPAAQAARLQQVKVLHAVQILCVENATPFYELIRNTDYGIRNTEHGLPLALLCLWGNPSPSCRHLLRRLVETLPDTVPLQVWADLDFGGFNILAQLREQVSPRFAPYRMDIETLEAHARWARPLTKADERNLKRIARHPALADVQPAIYHLLKCGLKLEQEAIRLF
ncbi:MAG TPA: Wadjet anti-phage system protein JetD domain-containing protein [Anaerolineales bacterium]|nr:Wadjet anti-phage system protein JetD domain-containing protein [Anaerolineales bacterium]